MWSFSQWGFDLIGQISPPSSWGHKFIITDTKYFIKWVEVVPMVLTKGPKIVEFIKHYIINLFGIPARILLDNGPNFKNKDMESSCTWYKIKHSFSTTYYLKANGKMKATNKTIVSILKKIVSISHRDWHIQIPLALWAYHTSIRTPMGATPFFLVYGAEVVIPLELEIPSLHF